MSKYRTCSTGIIHHDDLFEQDSGGRVQDAVDGPKEGGPSLVVEHYNDTGGGQRGTATELPLHTPGEGEKCQNREREREREWDGESVIVREVYHMKATSTGPLFTHTQGLTHSIFGQI